jgi:bifunctional ADP-heptose synthase (sugar kinase/adenylyltransferase)
MWRNYHFERVVRFYQPSSKPINFIEKSICFIKAKSNAKEEVFNVSIMGDTVISMCASLDYHYQNALPFFFSFSTNCLTIFIDSQQQLTAIAEEFKSRENKGNPKYGSA